NLVPRGFDVGSGEGLGPEMHTYIPEMAKFAAEIRSKFGAFTNTYSNHPMGFAQPHFRERSVDAWGGFRGDPVGIDRGNRIVDWAISRLGDNLNWLIWNGKMLSASGWGPDTSGFDHSGHVHTTAFADWATVNGGGGGGGGWWGSIKDAAGNVFGSAADAIKGLFPTVPNLSGMGVLGEGIQGWLKSMYDKAKDWVIDKASSFGGGGGGTYSGSMDTREWAEKGLKLGNAWGPVTEDMIRATMAQIQIESGGDPNAINNWDINALNGTPSKGAVQAIEPTWASVQTKYGADLGSFNENWMNPIKSVAAGSRSMKSQWGRWVWPTSGGYRRGGVIPGPAGAPRVIKAHAGERVLPGGATRSWDNVARALDRYGDRPHVRGMGSDALGGGGGAEALERAVERLTSRLDHQTEVLSDLLEELPEQTGKKLRPRIQRMADDTLIGAAKGRRR
ncbi:MAG: hypothetical protein M3Q49_10460, partial [Actinomycetota bacterium]|nr:hypothetical protein [Actinomycetota bacterium]